MKYTLFVLDFDGTYDIEPMESDGVQPTVYMIPLDRQFDVEYCAKKSSHMFHVDEEGCLGIGDYFEMLLDKHGIDFKVVGHIDLTFGERQEDYLADYIPKMIV